jgi:acyl-CoA synthetase (AMP-forming)/AMP-acid ligase II
VVPVVLPGVGPEPLQLLTSPWPDPAVPDVSLPEFLLATAAKFANRPAIVDAVSGRTLRYGELADGVRRVAAGLAALGLRPADAFAILAPNSPRMAARLSMR